MADFLNTPISDEEAARQVELEQQWASTGAPGEAPDFGDVNLATVDQSLPMENQPAVSEPVAVPFDTSIAEPAPTSVTSTLPPPVAAAPVITKEEAPKFAVPQTSLEPAPVQRENQALQSIQKYGQQMQAAQDLQAQIAQKQANAQLEVLKSQDQVLKDAQLEEQRAQAAHESAIKDKQKALDDELTALKNAPEIDPNRYFNNMSTGNKILAGFSILLGSVAQGLTNGKENPAWSILEKAVDKDIDAQKLQRKQQGENYERNKTLYDRLIQKGYDDKQARAATKVAALQILQNQFNMAAETYKSPAIAARARELAAETGLKMDLLQQQLLGQQQAQDTQVEVQRKLYSGKELTPQEISALPKDDRERYVPGYGSLATSKENAQEFNKYRAEVEPATQGIERIFKISSDPEFSKLDPEKRAQVSTELAALMGQLRLSFLGPGAMTEKEYERLRSAVGDPNKLASLPAWERAKLVTVYNKLNSDMNTRAKQAGLPPKTPVYSFKPQ